MPSIQFKGKTYVQNHHLSVKFHQLVPEKEKSLTDKVSLHDNLVIEGDNLLALKALLPIYAGKVKCIYIDPPYNTGNENWVYNDNVNSPMMQEWLGSIVDKEDLTRHDKWLCMMMPRLKLLKELLSEDGAIFISIDDNEQHRLRMLLDEVFGDNNFLTNIIWQKKYSTKADSNNFSESHDFITVYSKNSALLNLKGLKRTEIQESKYTNPDNDNRGPWMSGDITRTEVRDYAVYEITTPGGEKYLPPKGASWRFTREKFAELVQDNRIWFGEDGNNRPRLKRFLAEVRDELPPQTIWLHGEVGHSDSAKKVVNEIFGEPVFGTPKPTALLTRILELIPETDAVVLDSFSGSGTTAHAVLNMNKTDGGDRKFILIEMENYANQITAERVRRVIKGVPESKNFKEGTGGTFSYFRLGDPVEMEAILHGDTLPTYEELARYVFYTATGEEFDPKQITGDKKRPFIGESKDYEVFLFYVPEVSYLMNTALTLDMARGLGPYKEKKRLVFAPMKYLDQDYLDQLRMEYSQLPFEIYRFKE